MKIKETPIEGLHLIELVPICDTRGYFSRHLCMETLKKHGLEMEICQTSIAFNVTSDTIRGLHYQAKPFEEIKIVSCLRGVIFDVVYDNRPKSPTYKQIFTTELSTFDMLYIPKGCAHGYQTQTDNCLVHYYMSSPYNKKSAREIGWWNLDIPWPLPKPRTNT